MRVEVRFLANHSGDERRIHHLAVDDGVGAERSDGHLDERRKAVAVIHHGGKAPEELGEILLSRVFDLGCDLLVMGCYGHGRAREWVLGGVSRTLLSSMTLPVLMAH